MCKVQDIENCEKRLIINLYDGTCVLSEWFSDEERKNTYGKDRLTEKENQYFIDLKRKYNLSDANIDQWTIQRKKDEPDCIYISRHAFDRMKERNGWNKKTSLRMVKKIYDTGLNPDEVKGAYKAWVRNRMKNRPDVTLKLYGEMLYIFDNNVLITVIHGKKVA